MALAKLKIIPEPDPNASVDPNDPNNDGHIDVLFNPTTYSVSKNVSWVQPGGTNDAKANAPTTTFGGGGARTLSLELFYDVTGNVTGSKDDATDVRKGITGTDRIVELTHIRRDAEHMRPPVCRIEWGGDSKDFPFIGVVSSLNQQFLLFSESGRPLRATLSVVFMEFLNLKDDQLKTDPELTTRVVRRGDTLASIAAEAYRNPAVWRVIANANRIENPFALVPGTKLTLPKQ